MSAPATIRFTEYLDDGGELEHELPATFEVCPRCQGAGSHVNPAIDGHGITAEEWNGPDWDEDSRAMYLSGGYDVPCHRCDGKRVVEVLDRARVDPEILAAYDEAQAEIAALEAEEAFERRLGC